MDTRDSDPSPESESFENSTSASTEPPLEACPRSVGCPIEVYTQADIHRAPPTFAARMEALERLRQETRQAVWRHREELISQSTPSFKVYTQADIQEWTSYRQRGGGKQA